MPEYDDGADFTNGSGRAINATFLNALKAAVENHGARLAGTVADENGKRVVAVPDTGAQVGQVLAVGEINAGVITWELTEQTGGGGGGLTAEEVRDTIGAALAEGSGIDITVDDTANTITIAVASVPATALTGTIDDARIPAGITRDAELTAAISAAINGLLDGAPAALDTLNELAAAIGDNADYAGSITTALAAKAPLVSPAFTGTPTGITKTHVGLGNVDNTSDAGKPVSTAQQTALDGKAAASHTHTIANVTSLQTALDAKLAAASNLSDLTSASTARTNLGLGNVATRAVGTTAGTAMAGDDSRVVALAAQPKLLLIDEADDLPEATPAGVVVVVKG